ncbi:unnamed protein product [Blepharisma stoltei]|uniref:OTU domain-containing protein n=1 Tax=Blepharisma stoltei TaxID=1481888 RepID=A0AAU9IFM3_9CILI|nr:unnamed protein product [Blepharisma stoltei]
MSKRKIQNQGADENSKRIKPNEDENLSNYSDSSEEMPEYEEEPSNFQIDEAGEKPILEIVPIRGDGNCLYRSLAQILTGDQSNHSSIRQLIADHIERNSDRYNEALQDILDSDHRQTINQYIQNIREPSYWGGDLEISAASELFDLNIAIHSEMLRDPFIISTGENTNQTIHLLYTNGNHFDALIESNFNRSPLSISKISHSLMEPQKLKEISFQASKLMTDTIKREKENGLFPQCYQEGCSYEDVYNYLLSGRKIYPPSFNLIENLKQRRDKKKKF